MVPWWCLKERDHFNSRVGFDALEHIHKVFNQIDRWLVFTNAVTGIFLRIKCVRESIMAGEFNFRNYIRGFSYH